jgi:hypothetical protein
VSNYCYYQEYFLTIERLMGLYRVYLGNSQDKYSC